MIILIIHCTQEIKLVIDQAKEKSNVAKHVFERLMFNLNLSNHKFINIIGFCTK